MPRASAATTQSASVAPGTAASTKARHHLAADARGLAHEHDLAVGLVAPQVLDQVVGPAKRRPGSALADAVDGDVQQALATDQPDAGRAQPARAQRLGAAPPTGRATPGRRRSATRSSRQSGISTTSVPSSPTGMTTPAWPRPDHLPGRSGICGKRRVVVGEVEDVAAPVGAVGAAADDEQPVEPALGGLLRAGARGGRRTRPPGSAPWPGCSMDSCSLLLFAPAPEGRRVSRLSCLGPGRPLRAPRTSACARRPAPAASSGGSWARPRSRAASASMRPAMAARLSSSRAPPVAPRTGARG